METHIKRPQNSFMIWSNEFRDSIASSYPDESNSGISRILGTIWNNLDDETKLHYKKLSDQIKREHKIMYPEYRYKPTRTNRHNITNIPNIHNRPRRKTEDKSGFIKIPILQKAKVLKKKKVYVRKQKKVINHDDENYNYETYGYIVEPDYFTELQNFYKYSNYECCL
jgi:hypothetical protein